MKNVYYFKLVYGRVYVCGYTGQGRLGIPIDETVLEPLFPAKTRKEEEMRERLILPSNITKSIGWFLPSKSKNEKNQSQLKKNSIQTGDVEEEKEEKKGKKEEHSKLPDLLSISLRNSVQNLNNSEDEPNIFKQFSTYKHDSQRGSIITPSVANPEANPISREILKKNSSFAAIKSIKNQIISYSNISNDKDIEKDKDKQNENDDEKNGDDDGILFYNI